MSLAVLKIAVVGHTNTGKTSLLRTLTRDVSFGEVSDEPATTRHVEGTALLIGGRKAVELYDTPGLEQPMELLELLEGVGSSEGLDGPGQVERFLAMPEAHGAFGQEAKAIRQVVGCDVALYVIDARERILGKYRDELQVLARCARPIVPVLNYVASPQARTNEWRSELARINLHAVAEFDTVVLDEMGEQRLYEKMRTLLDAFSGTLDALIEERRRERERLIASSAALIADLLIDVAGCLVVAKTHEKADVEKTQQELEAKVREREQRCVEQLLELFRFGPNDQLPGDLTVEEGRWRLDLFSKEAARQVGMRTGSGAGVGAGIGLAADVALGGLSLGTGTAIGAALGAALGAGSTGHRHWWNRVRGAAELMCDDATLRLLGLRQIWLVREILLRRGHATQKRIQEEAQPTGWLTKMSGWRPPMELREARSQPNWSRLNPGTGGAGADRRREQVQRALSERVEKLLRQSDGGSEF